MKLIRWFFALLVWVSLSGACTSNDSGPMDKDEFCERVCEVSYDCDPTSSVASCVSVCMQVFPGSAENCSDRYTAAVQCLEHATCAELQDEICQWHFDEIEWACDNPAPCVQGDFVCASEGCTPMTFVCDGDCDCTDCSDEWGCT